MSKALSLNDMYTESILISKRYKICCDVAATFLCMQPVSQLGPSRQAEGREGDTRLTSIMYGRKEWKSSKQDTTRL